jgi:hypothetical protein
MQTKQVGLMVDNYVHTTTDYFLFKSIDGNRNVNLIHYKRLQESMKRRYVFTVIIVNENYEIIDGQHRFNCIKELGLPLHYIVCKGYGLNEVHILNANSKTWNADDYLQGYCNLGLKDYILYNEFKNCYTFGHNECMMFLSGRHAGDKLKMFYTGEFKIKNYDDAKRKADAITSIGEYYKGYNRRAFVITMIGLLSNKNFSFNEFISKLKLQPLSLIDLPSVEAYKSLIEEIYNYRRREKINLRY